MKRKGKFRVYMRTDNLQFSDWHAVYWYFNLCATNGRVIATSQMYKSKQACLKGLNSVRRNAPDAVVEIME